MNHHKDELFYWLVLQKVPNLGDASAKKLIQIAGSAKAVFEEKKSTLLKIEGIGEYKLKELHSQNYHSLAENELKFIDNQNIEVACYTDKKYPANLKHCIDSPIVLFSKGNINLNNKRIISVVGTRKITTYGAAFCKQLIDDLAALNVIVVSGFAFGVDIAAHKAALNNNLQTIACLAHGLNQIYPKVHSKYEESVLQNGGFLSEFWSTDLFDRNNFLKRNRVIAGLSEATVVIESAEKGGSLVTADIANSYNREVFAVPGKTTDSQSKGCNNLIKTQKAQMITSAADLIYALNWNLEEPKQQKAIQKQMFVELTPDENLVHNCLKTKQKMHIDDLAIACNMAVFKITPLLLNLELKGVVQPLPGKLFEAL